MHHLLWKFLHHYWNFPFLFCPIKLPLSQPKSFTFSLILSHPSVVGVQGSVVLRCCWAKPPELTMNPQGRGDPTLWRGSSSPSQEALQPPDCCSAAGQARSPWLSSRPTLITSWESSPEPHLPPPGWGNAGILLSLRTGGLGEQGPEGRETWAGGMLATSHPSGAEPPAIPARSTQPFPAPHIRSLQLCEMKVLEMITVPPEQGPEQTTGEGSWAEPISTHPPWAWGGVAEVPHTFRPQKASERPCLRSSCSSSASPTTTV